MTHYLKNTAFADYNGSTIQGIKSPPLLINQNSNTIQMVTDVHNPTNTSSTVEWDVAKVDADGNFISWAITYVIPEFGSWGSSNDKTILAAQPRMGGGQFLAGEYFAMRLRLFDGNDLYFKTMNLQSV